MNHPEKNACLDCGPDPVSHFAVWLGSFIENYSRPFGLAMNFLNRKIGHLLFIIPFADFALPIFRFLAWLKLGILTDKNFSDDNLRTLILKESADKKGVRMWQFRFGGKKGAEFFVAEKNGRWRVFESVPRPERIHSPAYVWMDNKATLRKKFRKAGLPVAPGGECFRYKTAEKIFRQIEKPVIVKPNLGSRSRHTFTDITTEEELKRAFYSAKKVSPVVIVEQELKGFVFRATLIGKKVAGVISREPANIIGNGADNIRTLVEKENQRPARKGPIFHEILVNEDAEKELAKQNLSWESIPADGQIVIIQSKVSRSVGASTADFTDKAHPENIALFEKAAVVVNDSLIGFDFIIENMENSWREQKNCGFIEANSAPFIDLHHYPLFGEARDAAGQLWDLIFPN